MLFWNIWVKEILGFISTLNPAISYRLPNCVFHMAQNLNFKKLQQMKIIRTTHKKKISDIYFFPTTLKVLGINVKFSKFTS